MTKHEQADQVADLQQWRGRLLSSVMGAIILAAVGVGIPNVAYTFAGGQIGMSITHALAVAWVCYLYRYRSRNPEGVKHVLLTGLYTYGVITMIAQSYLAIIYLVILPTIAAMLVSKRAAILWLLLTTLTVFLCGYFLKLDANGLTGPLFLSWLLIALNFLVVSAALAMGCDFLLSGLDVAMKQQRQDAQKLQHLAMHDTLTGLANRRFLNDRMAQAITHAQRHASRFAVLLMDLDHFKNINDSHGHLVGDELIKAVANRLQGLVRKTDVAVRLGGDEYVLMLTEVDNDAELLSAAQRIVDSITGIYICGQNKHFVSVSIGVAVYPRDGASVQELLKNADAAMYQAKAQGRNRYQFFLQEMNTRVMDRVKTEEDLRDALSREELVLHFQPRVSSVSGACLGAEALIRWRHPTRGLLMPRDFITIAEESGLIVPMGAWVLRAATEQLLLWQKKHPHLRLSINLSAREFRDESLGARIRAAGASLPGASLELEITESLIIDNLHLAQHLLDEVRRCGVSVALDDFGTGLSSLAYLKALPLDVIKIDQSFVHGVDTDRQNHAIVKTIIDLANSLQLSTVAEGVETQGQAEALRSLGVHELQGYHFARPMPADAFEAWLAQHPPTRDLWQV